MTLVYHDVPDPYWSGWWERQQAKGDSVRDTREPPVWAYVIEQFPYVGDSEFIFFATCTVQGCANGDGNPYRSGKSADEKGARDAVTDHWRAKHAGGLTYGQ